MKRRRRSARSRAFNWKRLPKIVLLAGGTVGLGWLAIKATAVEALARRNPAVAARFAPEDPRVPIATAMLEFRRNAGAVSPASKQRALAALADAPLAEEPFLLAGLSALIAGNPAKAAPLLEESKRRNPRSRVTRLLLLDRYLRIGDVRSASAEIATLGRLIGEANRVLVPELARLAATPANRAAIADVLRQQPEMRDRVLQHLASNKAGPEVVLRVAADSGQILPGQNEHWRAILLEDLVEKNDLAGARRLWARFTGVDEQAIGGGIYDPRFQGLPGSPPFNWAYASNAAGVAEPTKGPALQVEYYGRANTDLASQLLMLRPGGYRFSFRASGNTPGEAASVAWRLACHPSGAEIASLPIQKLNYAPALRGGEFSIPASGCPAQWLRLIGTASEFPAAHSVTISDLQVRPAGTP